jgi:hypothetical protein
MSDAALTTTLPSEESKAIQVAKDVLAHLHVYRPIRGKYIAGYLPRIENADADMSEYLSDFESRCDVCALGACLLSKVRLYDNVPVRAVIWTNYGVRGYEIVDVSGSAVKNNLDDVFSRLQLAMIESAFEQRVMSPAVSSSEESMRLQASVKFGLRYENARERLQAIMENIIDYDGTFNPPATKPDDGKAA